MSEVVSTLQSDVNSARYAKCVEVSKRIRWDIDADVIRGREFDFTNKLLPESLSLVSRQQKRARQVIFVFIAATVFLIACWLLT